MIQIFISENLIQNIIPFDAIIEYDREIIQRKISIILKDLLDEKNLINLIVVYLTL